MVMAWAWRLPEVERISRQAESCRIAHRQLPTAKTRSLPSKPARKQKGISLARHSSHWPREWYASRLTNWDAGTAKRIIGALERHVFPVFGKRPYADITPLEWMEFLRGMERQGILEQMSRVRSYCRDAYDLARVTGRATHNPLEGLQKYLQSGKAENYAHVSPDELPGLIRAIAAIHTPTTCASACGC